MNEKPRGPMAKRVLGYPARVVLGALMSLAVTVLERRMRGALRAGGEPARPARPARPADQTAGRG